MTNPSSQSKILIVGGSGFLSGTLAQRAVSRDNKVWTVTRGQRPLPTGSTNLIADRHDVVEFERVVNVAKTDWDLVIDCIAYSPEDIQQDIKVFEKLARHLVFVSTDFVYDPEYRQFPQREETNYYDTGGYGYQKRLSELELIRYSGGLPWTIVRPCHIYGPGSLLGCLPAHSRDVDLIKRLRAGEHLKLVGGGRFLQQPILARDLADFLLDLQGNKNSYAQVLNAAGPDVLESRTYYQIIAEILGVNLSVEEIAIASYLQENPNSRSFLCHRFYDLSKAVEIGIPLHGTSIDQGLKEHVESILAE
ncbi:NAD-dependent epimerase/dehydratase family protein [Chloroflexota bacterium]